MQKRARVFVNRRSQMVRLPKEFRFEGGEVFLSREGDAVVLSPRLRDWAAYWQSAVLASEEFGIRTAEVSRTGVA